MSGVATSLAAGPLALLAVAVAAVGFAWQKYKRYQDEAAKSTKDADEQIAALQKTIRDRIAALASLPAQDRFREWVAGYSDGLDQITQAYSNAADQATRFLEAQKANERRASEQEDAQLALDLARMDEADLPESEKIAGRASARSAAAQRKFERGQQLLQAEAEAITNATGARQQAVGALGVAAGEQERRAEAVRRAEQDRNQAVLDRQRAAEQLQQNRAELARIQREGFAMSPAEAQSARQAAFAAGRGYEVRYEDIPAEARARAEAPLRQRIAEAEAALQSAPERKAAAEALLLTPDGQLTDAATERKKAEEARRKYEEEAARFEKERADAAFKLQQIQAQLAANEKKQATLNEAAQISTGTAAQAAASTEAQKAAADRQKADDEAFAQAEAQAKLAGNKALQDRLALERARRQAGEPPRPLVEVTAESQPFGPPAPAPQPTADQLRARANAALADRNTQLTALLLQLIGAMESGNEQLRAALQSQIDRLNARTEGRVAGQ